MSSEFKGFCFNKEGYHTPTVILNDVPAVFDYCKLHGCLQYEVRITDYSEDYIVMQVINGIVVWPESLYGKHISEISTETEI